jgi:tripartite-type tricarboxylate transporter receptor subunit TctC
MRRRAAFSARGGAISVGAEKETSMDRQRRRFLQLSAAALAAPVLPRIALAEDYPTRPIKMIVGFPAGNAPDIVARLIGQWLSEKLGQQVVIDNRPGAASNIATEAAVNAAPDGYTIMMTVLTNVFNQALYSKLRFNFMRDIASIGGIADAPYLLLVNPKVPAKTVAELVAYAKANPGKLNFASGGIGSSSHIFGELFKTLAGVDIVHVPYRSNYMPDMISGQVQVTFSPMPQGIAYYHSGELRALGVSTPKRLADLPDVPPIDETVKGYAALGWYGLGAPKGTPPEIIAKLNAALNAGLRDEALKAKIAKLGVQAMPMTPPEFDKFVARDYDKWSKVIKDAGIKLD